MQQRQKTLVSLLKVGLCAFLALGMLVQAQAQEKKANPTGTWTWTMAGRNGGPDRKMTLKLKVEDGKLTGKLITPGRDGQDVETKIEEGAIKGEEFSFNVTREFNGNKMTSKYTGKIVDGAIKGKIETERNGQTRSRDWEAKKGQEAK